MSVKHIQDNSNQDIAARIIQRAWKTFLAQLLDAAAGVQVRFRLGGVRFPPEIYYKIFTHRHIEDLCANSPRDYTKLPARYTSHNKDDPPQVEDNSGWYRRVENNGWRPVSYRFWMPLESGVVDSTKEREFHFSKLKRKQDLEKKRKIKKIDWMRQMYYMGSLEAKATDNETLGLIHKATKGLIKSIEDGGVDSVMEWEVDEVLNWTNTLNFDEYIASWRETATSNSSANLKDVKLQRIQKSLRSNIYGDEAKQAEESLYDDSTYYENAYTKQFTRVTPDSMFGM